MTKKFDLKNFAGDMVWLAVAGHRSVRRRLKWNQQNKRYEDPRSGALYEVRRVCTQGKRRESKTFSSLRSAIEWRDRRSNDPVEPEVSKSFSVNGYTIAKLVEDFKAKRFPFLSVGSQILYERRLKLLGPLLQREVESITSRDISDWIEWLRNPERISNYRKTRVSFEKELKALSAILRWHIEENDDSQLIFPIKQKHFDKVKIRKSKPRQVLLSDFELDRWLEALKKMTHPIYHAMATVQVFQALRVSEVCAMKWSNLDLNKGRYEIREHVIWPRVGGLKPQLVPGTKTRTDWYAIPLWEDVQKVLKSLLIETKSDLIFTLNGELLTYRQVQFAYDSAFKAAGLPHRGTHVCRHTGSTIFLDKTQDLLALQQLGGWKDQHMPQHYAKIRSSRLEAAMRETERKLKLVANPQNEVETT